MTIRKKGAEKYSHRLCPIREAMARIGTGCAILNMLCRFIQVMQIRTGCVGLGSTKGLRLGFTQAVLFHRLYHFSLIVKILVLRKACGLKLAQAMLFCIGCVDFSPTKDFKVVNGTSCAGTRLQR